VFSLAFVWASHQATKGRKASAANAFHSSNFLIQFEMYFPTSHHFHFPFSKGI